MVRQSVIPLLVSVAKDAPTFKFPVECIQKELVAMFLGQQEFEYFVQQSYKKLKTAYGGTVAHIYLNVIDLRFKECNGEVLSISNEHYLELFEEFISTLENLYIHRIEKYSPDAEILETLVTENNSL